MFIVYQTDVCGGGSEVGRADTLEAAQAAAVALPPMAYSIEQEILGGSVVVVRASTVPADPPPATPAE